MMRDGIRGGRVECRAARYIVSASTSRCVHPRCHIAGCAMFSILIVIFILIVFFAHTQTPHLHWTRQLSCRAIPCRNSCSLSTHSIPLSMPIAPGVCSWCVCVCVFTTVCVHLDGLNAEHKFQVWDTILGKTSLHFTSHKTDSREH